MGLKKTPAIFFLFYSWRIPFKKAISKASDFAYLLPIFLLRIPKEMPWKTTDGSRRKIAQFLEFPILMAHFKVVFATFQFNFFLVKKVDPISEKKIVKLLVVGIGIDEQWRLKLTLEVLFTKKNKCKLIVILFKYKISYYN